MDPLSEVLSLLKPRSYVSGGFGVDGHLAVQFPRHEGIKCYAMLAGQCWLVVEGVSQPVLLNAGDCFLLPRGLPFRLATDPALTPVDFHVLKAANQLAAHSGGYDPARDAKNYIAGGHFLLSGSHAGELLRALPPIVHIRREQDKAAMRWALDTMRAELRDQQPGSALIAQQLAYMMLVQALRLYLTEEAGGAEASQQHAQPATADSFEKAPAQQIKGEKNGRSGWLFALADRQMSAAIAAMHAEPGRAWTLEQLAGCVGMSRSVFALRFRQTVGATPMEYLARWRMLLAADRLTTPGDSLGEIARSLGYESESAFGKAFRRVMGCSPRQYSQPARSAA